ncbi:MAG TPA: TIR domain-containing protein [Thermoanaerobaculia bacterium]|nr:TIR domain-containing protein [Thermoanaerobaculia bacterium]
MLYKAFISYSHASDASLASALQSGLQGFARPWYKLRAIRVFRDKTSLAVNAGLWPSIEKALEQSEYFVALASPAAAASPWVRREIDYWLAHRPPQTLLVVVTEGTVTWDAAAGSFDWNRTTALPPELGRAFKDEPLHLDLCWARAEQHLSIRNPRFQDAIAGVAATLHNRPKDDLVGEDVRRHRNAMRLAWGAVVTLAALTLAATVAAYVAVQQRNLATERLRVATSRQLAVQALSVNPQEIDLAMLLAVEANRRARTPEAISTLQALLERASRLATIIPGPVRGFAFQPDGAALAVAMADGSIHRFDTRSFRPAGAPLPSPDARSLTLAEPALAQPAGLPMTGAPESITRLVFAADGRSLVAVSPSANFTPPLDTVYQWNLSGVAPIRRVDRGHMVAVSPGGDTVAIFENFSNTHRILFWSGREQRLLGPPLTRHGATPVWGTFSASGERLAVGYHDDAMELWTGLDRAPSRRLLKARSHGATSALISADGGTLWVGRQSGTIDRVALATGEPLTPLSGGHDAGVVGLAAVVSKSGGATLTSIGEDGTIVEWDAGRANVPHQTVGRLPPPIGAVVFSRDASLVAAFQRQSDEALGAVTLWSRPSPSGIAEYAANFSQLMSGELGGERLPIVPAPTRAGNAYDSRGLIALRGLQWSFHAPPVAFDPAGRLLATALPGDRLALWHLGQERSLGWRPKGAATGFAGAALSPDGHLLAWASADSVNIMDLRRGEQLAAIPVPGMTVTSVAFNRDGKRLAFAGSEQITAPGRVHVVDLATRQPLMPPLSIGTEEGAAESGRGFVVALAFSADADRIVTRSYDGSIVVWNLKKGTPAAPARTGVPFFLDLAMHPKRPLLAVAVEADTIRFLDVTNGELTSTPDVKTSAEISSIAFTPDGDRLTVALQDGTVRSWNPDTQQPAGSPLKLPSAATSIAYTGDGRHLAVVFGTASGSTVQLWSVERRERVLPDLSAPAGQTYQVMVASDASRLVWVSEGHGPIVWDARLDSWLARACRIANRDLTEAEWNRFLPSERYARVCALQP